jgi:hypothetical protein
MEVVMGSDQQALLETAREYCRLIESARADDDDWLNALAQVLPRLHAQISALDPPHDGQPTGGDADLDSRFELFSRLHETLGERDSYWLEYDAPPENHQGTGSLADDLTDIYFDLKRGLSRLAANDDPRPTFRGWRAGFSVHWGQHLVDAERHLYALNSRNQLV